MKWLVNPYYNNILNNLTQSTRSEIYSELMGVGIDFVDALDTNVALSNGNYILIDYGYKTKLY
jgi:SAM-dependent MidA family methyltransferase